MVTRLTAIFLLNLELSLSSSHYKIKKRTRSVWNVLYFQLRHAHMLKPHLCSRVYEGKCHDEKIRPEGGIIDFHWTNGNYVIYSTFWYHTYWHIPPMYLYLPYTPEWWQTYCIQVHETSAINLYFVCAAPFIISVRSYRYKLF